jgi:hypothetical protein
MATAKFPNSNLPTTSQPWGREVEKRIVDTAIKVDSNEVNNAARDRQLLSALNRTNLAVKNAQDAIDSVISVEEAVYYPGTTEIDGGNIRANTIAANKISAGELVGFTIKTAFTGSRRVELSGTDIRFYDENGDYTGNITGSDVGRASSVNIASISGSGIFAYDGGADLVGPGTTISAGTSGDGSATISSSGNVYISSNSGANTLSINSKYLDSSSTGTFVKNGAYIQCADTYNRNVQQGRIMYVASNGTYNCASSSERYKQDIAPYEVDVEKLLLLEPVSFRYKQSVAEFGEAADVAHGFIAEQADSIGLTEFVDYELDSDGNPRPDNFRYIDFTAALLSVVKKQQETINSFEARLEALESKV